MNTHLPVSNTTSPHEMEKWEVLVSEIRDQRYILIDVVCLENALVLSRRALETLVNKRDAAYEGESFNGEVIQPSPTEWQPGGTVIQSHTPHVHPFDSHKRLLAILNDRPYISLEPPDDAPTFNVRGCNRKATEKRNILWYGMRQDPHHESEDWEDFKQSKRNSESQHYRTSHDELAKTIFNNTASAGPSRLTTTLPKTMHSKRNNETQYRRTSRDELTSTIYNNTTLVSPLGLTTTMPSWFDPPCWIGDIASNNGESFGQASLAWNNYNGAGPTFDITRTASKISNYRYRVFQELSVPSATVYCLTLVEAFSRW
ncbi:hypothetical protein ARMGADRAFT_1032523 [Armillaria gallica]|uniref:Uncharacterized protein n=1 Tax=Armillaria gallica TaxID=47427 RepID=A0A2H3DN59_ARMGA|nr:hypothetical protein ARMGADRAFT_1032523 [Armillaria gallica]